MRLYQIGVPKISFNTDGCYLSEWTKGVYYGVDGVPHPYMAELFFEVDFSRSLASDTDAFQYYHSGQWHDISLTSTNKYSVPLVSDRDDTVVSGTEDIRLLFPNGSMVYASEPLDYEYAPLPHLTSSGVGPIQLKMNIASIPATVPGFYDRLTTAVVEVTGEGGYDEMEPVLRAWLGEEKMIDIYYYDSYVYMIDVHSGRLKTLNGLSLNSTAREIFAVGAEVQAYSDWTYATYSDGVHFYGLDFTKAGWAKLEQVFLDGIDRTFTIADMIPDSTPTNIRIW